MAVNQADDGFVLPCGRELEELWAALEAGTAVRPGGHEQSCPHCRTALSGLTALRDATRALAAEPVPVPGQLTGRIMAAVRAEVRRSRMVPLPAPEPEPGGHAEISEQAVAAVLRFAADGIEGIRARRCTVRPHADNDNGAGGGRPGDGSGLVDVAMTLAIRYGTSPAQDVLDAVRRAVMAAGGARIGLRVARCDLYVEDVYQ
jgi:hypothetical protein